MFYVGTDRKHNNKLGVAWEPMENERKTQVVRRTLWKTQEKHRFCVRTDGKQRKHMFCVGTYDNARKTKVLRGNLLKTHVLRGNL